jgi:hypothetical protein
MWLSTIRDVLVSVLFAILYYIAVINIIYHIKEFKKRGKVNDKSKH